MSRKRNDDGAVRLGYAIIELAVEDLKDLQARGLIVNGCVKTPWPERGSDRTITGNTHGFYRKAFQAEELLAWFRGGSAAEWLSLLQAPIEINAMLKHLGIAQTERETA